MWILCRFVSLCYLISSVWSQTTPDPDNSPMLIMLDAMQQMMTGEDFDRDFYDKLNNYMNMIDPRLRIVQDKYWGGIMDYWHMNGTSDDRWGSDRTIYMEYNPKVTDADQMIIYEPCNYASNIAYYHDFAEMCDRYFLGGVLQRYSIPDHFLLSIATAFTYTSIGSSFMHGTNTRLGSVEDNNCLGLQAYQVYQAMLDPLERNPILHDLSLQFREYTAFEMMQNLTDMYFTAPVTQWEDRTVDLGIPDYYLTYAGMIAAIFDICLPESLIDMLVPILSGVFDVDDYIVDFIEDYYLPEYRNVTRNLDLNVIELNRFRLNAVSTFIKLLYALVWQESTLTDREILLDPDVNALGAELLPVVNTFANRFSTFPYYNEDFQNGTNVYPGDFLCNPVIPHAKWHLESAIGLIDLAYLGDSLHNLLSTLNE